MLYVKYKYRDRIYGLIPVGYRHGERIYDIIFCDGTSVEIFESEISYYFDRVNEGEN